MPSFASLLHKFRLPNQRFGASFNIRPFARSAMQVVMFFVLRTDSAPRAIRESPLQFKSTFNSICRGAKKRHRVTMALFCFGFIFVGFIPLPFRARLYFRFPLEARRRKRSYFPLQPKPLSFSLQR